MRSVSGGKRLRYARLGAGKYGRCSYRSSSWGVDVDTALTNYRSGYVLTYEWMHYPDALLPLVPMIISAPLFHNNKIQLEKES